MPKMIFSFLLCFVVIFCVYQVIIGTPKEVLIKFFKGLIPVFGIVLLLVGCFVVLVNLF